VTLINNNSFPATVLGPYWLQQRKPTFLFYTDYHKRCPRFYLSQQPMYSNILCSTSIIFCLAQLCLRNILCRNARVKNNVKYQSGRHTTCRDIFSNRFISYIEYICRTGNPHNYAYKGLYYSNLFDFFHGQATLHHY
jgi:hypothetical protein